MGRIQLNVPQYAKHGDHRHGQWAPEAKYLKAATHGSRWKMQDLHKLLIWDPKEEKQKLK